MSTLMLLYIAGISDTLIGLYAVLAFAAFASILILVGQAGERFVLRTRHVWIFLSGVLFATIAASIPDKATIYTMVAAQLAEHPVNSEIGQDVVQLIRLKIKEQTAAVDKNCKTNETVK